MITNESIKGKESCITNTHHACIFLVEFMFCESALRKRKSAKSWLRRTAKGVIDDNQSLQAVYYLSYI